MAIMNGAESFAIGKGDKVALCIHGFSSSPHEFRELGAHLTKDGWIVEAPLLIGHGTRPQDLLPATYEQWYEQMSKRIQHYKHKNKKISLIGVSMGGCLAFDLASKHDIQHVVSIGTPVSFRFGRLWSIIIPLIRRFKPYHRKRYPARHKHALKNRVHYWVIPLQSIYQVTRGISLMKKALPSVTCPSLILQSDDDALLKGSSAYYIYKNLKSKNKRIDWVPNSYHVVILDRLKKEVFKKIQSFLAQ